MINMPLPCSMISLWRLTITAEMVGLEACVAFTVILMIANVQTLGVPIKFSSLPGTVSASTGILLIPTLGIVLDRWGKSLKVKARILTLTTFIEFIGLILVFIANSIKLTQTKTDTIQNISCINLSDVNYDKLNAVQYFLNKTTNYSYDVDGLNVFMNTLLEATLTNATERFNSLVKYPSDMYQMNDTTTSPWTTMSNTTELTSITPIPCGPTKIDLEFEENTIPFFAYFAMVGYSLLDCGYDASVCFLKTFALDCAPSSQHTDIIVSSIMVSAVGGVLTAILCSFDIKEALLPGTNYDSNSVLVCVGVLVNFTLLAAGTGATMLTGIYWRPDFNSRLPDGEKESLLEPGPSTVSNNHELTSSAKQKTDTQTPISDLERTLSFRLVSTSIPKGSHHASPIPISTNLSYQPGFLGFLQRHRKNIITNFIAFTMCSSLYSFEVFAVNFVGVGIFGGDPSADSNSDKYKRFLEGVAVGSQGTLIYYVVFAVCSICHQKILQVLGWKIETVISSLVYAVLCLICALSSNIWAYYAVSVWTGGFRTIAVSVPYILANKFSAERNGGTASSTAIAIVAAMLPFGFLLCSAVLGPLIDATGNPATPLYYSAAASFAGCMCALVLRER